MVGLRVSTNALGIVDTLAAERGESRSDTIRALLKLGLQYRGKLPPPSQSDV